MKGSAIANAKTQAAQSALAGILLIIPLATIIDASLQQKARLRRAPAVTHP
jgi:hypothetical protein